MLDFIGFKKTVDDLAATVKGHEKAAEAAKRERDEVQSMAVAKEDAIALLHRRIDDEASHFPADLARSLAGFIPSSKAQRLAENFPVGMLLPQAAGAGREMSSATLMHDLCFILREPLKKAIAEAITAAPWPGKTITLAERTRRLDEIDTKIGKLEAEAREIREQAAAAGIVIR